MTLLGKAVGGIRVIDTIGKGGMGEVYLGYDERLKRKVALKALRGENRLRAEAKTRFLREAQLLSQLEHPNICRIYGLVEEDDQEFLVLEFISGKSLRKEIQEGPDPKKRLALAIQVARALASAHAKGIIHRDLKPDNVMVDEDGCAKVLDFGLSRSLGFELAPTADLPPESTLDGFVPPAAPGERGLDVPMTRAGSVVGTLGYMSPEQAQGVPVTPASDVYSLGLLFQELFTGRPPYPPGRSPQDLLADARSGTSLPAAGIDADLAQLINRMKSLTPAVRPSVVDVVAALERVADKPRMRRRRGLVAAASVLLACLSAVMTFQAIRIGREAARANREAEAARQVSSFLLKLFKVSDPGEARGSTVTAREILDTGAQKISQELKGQPATQARLMTTMGTVYRELGLYPPAAELLERALSTRRKMSGSRSPDVAETGGELALCYMEQGRYEDAEALFREALAIQEESLGGGSPEAAKTLNNMAGLYWAQGNLSEARRLCARALEIREKVLGPSDPEVANTLTNLAILSNLQGDAAKAEELFWRALSVREKAQGEDHPDVVSTLTNLATLYAEQGKTDRAEPLFKRALSISKRTLGENHPNVATCLSNLGDLCTLEGKPSEALPFYRQALAIWEKALGPEHPDTAYALCGMANALKDLGRFSEAGPLYRRTLEIREKKLGPRHPEVIGVLEQYADFLRKSDSPAEAAKIEEELASRK